MSGKNGNGVKHKVNEPDKKTRAPILRNMQFKMELNIIKERYSFQKLQA